MAKEYIEREALITEIEENINTYWNEGSGGYYLAEDALNYSIKTAPTADVAPVIHAEWVPIPSPVLTFRCGNIDCARKIPFGCLPNELKFCPFCGAIMDGGNK